MRNKKIKRAWLLYIIIAIPIIWYIIFCYIPMAGIIISFKDYNLYKGLYASPWIGFKHFARFLGDSYFWQVLRNTFILGFTNLVVNFPAPIILALVLNEVKPGLFKKTTQTVVYLPHFVSTVALVNCVITLLSPSKGVVNHIIKQLGGQPINFVIEQVWFVPIYIIILTWRDIGWGTIIYLAAMSSIDPELYQVAEIDGAGRLRKVWSITLPSIASVIGIMFILSVPGILGADFETVLLLQQPITYTISDVVPTYIYRRGILNGEFDFATALGLTFSIVSIIILYISNKIGKKFASISIW